MLQKYKNKLDSDGYLMLLLSMIVVFVTVGMSYIFCFRKIYTSAKYAETSCGNNKIICVLGKKLLNDKPDDEYTSRLHRASIILNKDSCTEVILLGGKTGCSRISEAKAGKEYLMSKNIDTSRIYLEEKSRNTLENFINAVVLLKAKNKGVVVISNRYHLARAKQLAKGLGLNAEVCAAEEKLTMNTVMVLKMLLEALYVHWYSVGRQYAHITKNNRIIRRIG